MTNEEIAHLIGIRKTISSPPTKEFKLAGMQQKKDFEVESAEGHQFKVFIRKHTEFLENFSVGLLYKSTEGRAYMLFRANGNHGETVTDPWRLSPHFDFHYHQLSEEEIESGNLTDPKFAQVTSEYRSLEEAIRFFVSRTNIVGADVYFPFIGQLGLFD